jgi:hypothetical protein
MLGPIVFDDLSWCDWMIIGGQTSTNQPGGHVPAIYPEFEWVANLVRQCKDVKVPVFLKDNLGTKGMLMPREEPRRRIKKRTLLVLTKSELQTNECAEPEEEILTK